MAEVGRPSSLTDELTLDIRRRVLMGIKYKDIQAELGILESTWDYWVYANTKDFRTKLNNWKKERLVKLSEKVSSEILEMPCVDEEGKTASDLLRIKQKEAEFIRETLGKDQGYVKKQELSGEVNTNVRYNIVRGDNNLNETKE